MVCVKGDPQQTDEEDDKGYDNSDAQFTRSVVEDSYAYPLLMQFLLARWNVLGVKKIYEQSLTKKSIGLQNKAIVSGIQVTTDNLAGILKLKK